jgi:hypothetical protein
MTKFLNTAITAAPTPCAPSRRPPPRYGQRKRCRCRAPSWLQYSPPARGSDCYEKLRSGCPQCQDGDGRHGCQRGFGPRCSRRVLRPAQFPPSYRRRLFVVLDLGESSGSAVDPARRAGYPGTEQMSRKMLRNVEKRGVHTARNGPSPPPTLAGGPVAKPEMSTADRLGSSEGSSRAGPPQGRGVSR